MSIQSEINRLSSAKTAIGTAIAAKGITVPENTKLDGMAALIQSIATGSSGSGSSSTVNITNETVTNLSVYVAGQTVKTLNKNGSMTVTVSTGEYFIIAANTAKLECDEAEASLQTSRVLLIRPTTASLDVTVGVGLSGGITA